MAQAASDLERDVLALLAQNYEGRGFRFISYPSRDLLPEFVGTYQPDALAVGANENVIIEVTASGARTKDRLDEIASRVSAHPGWRFVVYYAGDAHQQLGPVERLATPKLLENLAEIQKLTSGGHLQAAFILSWSLLEAIFRTIEANQGKTETKPQSPGRVVEQLEALGCLSDAEAKRLRTLIPVRNRIVHGGMSLQKLAPELGFMEPLLGKLVETVDPQPRP